MAKTMENLNEKVQKLRRRIDGAKTVVEDDACTKRQVVIHIQHIERLVRIISTYHDFKPTEDENFNYEELTAHLFDESEEVLIDLTAILHEMETAENVAPTAKAEPAKTMPLSSTCNIKVTIPKFKGDYSEYPKFKSAFETATNADRKSKPEKLRVLEQYLEGRPLKLIQNLPPTEEGFEEAIQILDETFNVPERQKQSILTKIRQLPQATDDLKSIRENYEELESLLRALQTHEDIDTNTEYRMLVMSKYSPLTLDRISPTEIPTLQVVRTRVKQIVRTKEDIDAVYTSTSAASSPSVEPVIPITVMQTDAKQRKNFVPNSNTAHSVASFNQTQNSAKSTTKESKNPGTECIFCSRSNHSSENCRTYPTAVKRIEKLPSFTCHLCLQFGHIRRNCKTPPSDCKICNKPFHHTALCPSKFGYFKERPDRNFSTTSNSDQKSTSEQILKTTVALLTENQSSYLTARATIRNPVNGLAVNVRIFLDCGCNKTFILQRVARDLRGTSIGVTNLAVGVFLRPEIENLKADIFELEIIDPTTGGRHALRANAVPRITDDIVTMDESDLRQRYEQLERIKLAETANSEEIAILIGNDYLWRFILPETKIQLEENLYAINTLFGWLVVGQRNDTAAVAQTTSMHVSTKFINVLWSLDAIGINDQNLNQTQEEQMALEQFNATIRYVQEERRYEVGLPFREIKPKLPTNYKLAKNILANLLRRYKKKPEYLKACTEIFQQQIESGIIELAPKTKSEETHYLPFHFVEREGKSTPIRVVYNGSAKTTKANLSLNETLYKGINLLNDMIGVLLRFRTRPIVVISDVEKAFHQITMAPQYRDYTRFIWTENTEETDNLNPIIYRFRRIPFGIISSPFILAATILYHLNRYNSPVTQRIRQDIYADNIITTFASEKEAWEFYTEAMEIFDAASLPLRQWHSNSQAVREAIPVEYRDKQKIITILGLRWNTDTDMLQLEVPEEQLHQEPSTMLSVLQLSSKIYDPLGFFTPISIRSRMFLQKLHVQKYDWETKINDQEEAEWKDIRDDLFAVQQFEFQRHFGTSSGRTRSYQIHIFTDASIKAYAAVAYLRIETEDREVSVHLLMAKSRVTPLKTENQLTIPRLELMAAVLGTRLAKTVTKACELPLESTHHWIDNKCVLSWLQTNAALPIFVRNRVSEIRQLNNISHRYVSSKDNPADLASRGVQIHELHDPSTLWFHGPPWLKWSEDDWPNPPSVTEDEQAPEEIHEPHPVLTVLEKEKLKSPFEIQSDDYVTYTKLIRTTAICVEFIRRFRIARQRELFPNPEIRSIEYALHMWILHTQQSELNDVFERLQQNKTSNLIKKLKPFIDETGVIRLSGRFVHAPLTFAEKNPILLPKPNRNHFTQLLVLHHHTQHQHAGIRVTLTAVRRRYWILEGRKQTASVIRKCNACRRENARPYQQPTQSMLPSFRLEKNVSPLTHIGLDIAGHFWVRSNKRWILLVTCLVTRAIALECLENLETTTVLLALKRTQITTPIFYLSDNAAQFLAIKHLLSRQSAERFEWKFTPPFMPWAGGAYERLVKVVKTSLYATLREEVNVSDLQFRTILQQIARTLNDRPLTYMGEEFNGQPLTPNHFLRVQLLHDQPEYIITASDSTVTAFLKHQLKQNEELLTRFWRVWSREYLQFLRERTATMTFRRQTNRFEPRIGDIVLLHDPVQSKRKWHMALVTQIQRSEDNAVRSAIVKLGTGTKVVRPVEKIYYMELNEYADQNQPIPPGDAIGPPPGIENIYTET